MHPLIDFFARPRLRGRAILKIATALFKVLSENPDIVDLSEEDFGEILLVIKESGRVKAAFIFGAGSMRTFASEEEAIKSAKEIRYTIRFEKNSWRNIVEGMNKANMPFVEGARIAQEEIKNGGLSITPMQKPLRLFLSIDAEEAILKFSPAFGVTPATGKIWMLPWYITKFSTLALYHKLLLVSS